MAISAAAMGLAGPVAISPDGSRAYVANAFDGTLSVISIVPTVTSIDAGGRLVGAAISPDGTRAYVTDVGTDSVVVVDTVSRTVITTVVVGDNPQAVGVNAAVPGCTWRTTLTPPCRSSTPPPTR